MIDSVGRWLSAPASLYRASKSLRRRSWPQTQTLRSEVRNWFFLHLLASSALLHVLLRRFGDHPWVQRRSVRVDYRRGFSLFLPLTDAHSLPWLVEPMDAHYLAEFKRSCGRALSFEAEDVVVDIGANVGRFAVPLCVDNPGIRVFAFEPNPQGFECLSRATKANQLDRLRFHVDRRAVYNRPGRLRFSPGSRSTVGWLTDVGSSFSQASRPTIEVGATTLEEIFRENDIERCKLLKVDSEGSEYSIFESASPEVMSRIDALIAEVHPIPGRDPSALLEHLRTQGFDVRELARPDGSWEIFGLQNRVAR